MVPKKFTNQELPEIDAARLAVFQITGLAKIARASLDDISEAETEYAVRGMLTRIGALTSIIFECAFDDSATEPMQAERLADIQREIGMEVRHG